MNGKYLSLGNWIDKKSGQPKSKVALITGGISKEGKPYQMAQIDKAEIIDGTHPVGTFLGGGLILTPESPTTPSSAPTKPATPNISRE